MRIGIAFDLKPDAALPAGAPDDLHEEFDSPATVQAIADVLRSLGHTPSLLGNGRAFLESLLRDPPDLVFNFAEGHGVSRSREARVPAVCEMLDVPHTGSDPLALAVALDKDMTRRVVAAAGVVVPAGFVLDVPPGGYDGDGVEFGPVLEEAGLALPVILKPVCEGSSKGIRNRCVVRTTADFGPTVAELWRNYRQAVLVEEFVAGDEVTVGILGHDPAQVIGAMRVVPKVATAAEFVYSLEVKREYEKHVTYEVPAKLPLAVAREVEAAALTAFAALGCRDVARADFRIRNGVPYFLEVNPLPGLNPVASDLVILAAGMGVSYAALIGGVVASAAGRYGLV